MVKTKVEVVEDLNTKRKFLITAYDGDKKVQCICGRNQISGVVSIFEDGVLNAALVLPTNITNRVIKLRKRLVA